ncbi:Hypothetical protein SMAX5B_002564 [Scophthalmus maximus]|uniref:Uncharacterized protein n=1 Tax=Scophthalmus maximus TaxID=52904 RepID=A0A2U9AX55_SCOMX|nr:uncharacterized protein LOC118285537 [Scophthalmus maximus]AWO96208.1 Hypothetical protein SMAX5B_002564 [Scophthalmus maximus]KAF0032002.1 hypothetical protein F2P81_016557 [Scophthalmus maximus]
MFSFLLSVVALTLLPVAAASSSFSSGGGDSPPNHSYDLSGSALSALLNSPVHDAERMKRPLEGATSWFGPVSHSGVRVTLEDGTKWLVHKGDGFGVSSQTVVTDARHMSSAWEPVSQKDFQGTKRVTDFVREGGTGYNLLLDNCHLGSRRMMDQ